MEIRNEFSVELDPDRNLRKRTIEFGDVKAYLGIKRSDDTEMLTRLIECVARELAPCTDPACPRCWQRRRPIA